MMSTQDRPTHKVETKVEKTLRRPSRGFWWTVGAITLFILSHLLMEVWPTWFVEPTGQVGGEVGLFSALIAGGLLYGSRVARWITIAFAGLLLFHSWEMLTGTDFRKTGWLAVAALNVAALGILAFVPAVKSHFANDDTS